MVPLVHDSAGASGSATSRAVVVAATALSPLGNTTLLRRLHRRLARVARITGVAAGVAGVTGVGVHWRGTGDGVVAGKSREPSVDVLLDLHALLAAVCLLYGLRPEGRAGDIAVLIHSPLERVTFPAKDVIGVLPESGTTTSG